MTPAAFNLSPSLYSSLTASSIDIAVLDGRDISLLDNALDGKEFNGTLVRSA